MTFAQFSHHLATIDATTKRNEMTTLLVGLLKAASADEVDKVVYLSLGQLAPLYAHKEFGIAEKMVIRAVARAFHKDEAEVRTIYKKTGDLGDCVLSIAPKSSSSLRLFRAEGPNSLNSPMISSVFSSLTAIADASGTGSQEQKLELAAKLLNSVDPLGAKYIVRIILDKLRLGFSDKTVLDALSVLIKGDKSARERLEAIYNVHPDVGWLAKEIQSLRGRSLQLQGPSSIRVSPTLGVPVLPALCQRLPSTEEIIEKMGEVAVEPKWDGQRIQAHAWILRKKEEGKRTKEDKIIIKLFTRGLEDVTDMFPDLTESLKRIFLPSSFNLLPSSFILDGEVVGVDPKSGRILPFQTMITRKRKYGVAEQLKSVPIRYMVFDILSLNGESLLEKPFSKRREILEKSFPYNLEPRTYNLSLAPQIVTDTPRVIRDYLHKQTSAGLEGIVTKQWSAPYVPGRTGFTWVKMKWEGEAKTGGLLDTIDCVVMGTYAGRGKRSNFGAGAFLVGILGYQSSVVGSRLPVNRFSVSQSITGKPTTGKPVTENRKQKTDNGIFLTISKIGTGLSDEQWRELKAQSSKFKVQSCPKEYSVPKELIPDIWLEPKIVVEIQADNITNSPLHTAGFALRFPRLVRYRSDKRPEQSTTLEEVKKLYALQK